MSFILDALKKSEAERLKNDTPGFADLPGSAPEKRTAHWIWIVAALIVINLGVLIVIFMKPDHVADPVAANPAAQATSGLPAAASLSATVEETGPVKRPAAMPADPVTRAVTAIATPSADPAPPGARYESPHISEFYATFNDLRAQGVLQLPDMHLDIHVYSSEPEDRFVFVNMSKYKERATLDEGPVVREITPDGVILEHFGTKFLLPRE